MALKIRPAEDADAAAIAKISTEDLGYPCTEAQVLPRLRALSLQRERVFAAERDGAVIGFVHAEKYCLLYEDSMVNILGIAVSQSQRGTGAGRALIEAVEAWAEELGCHAVRLNSAAGRKSAHAFYQHLGYQHTKEQYRFLKQL